MSEHVAPAHSKVGELTSAPLDGGPVVVSDLVACGHCGYVWVYKPGSGKRRGFCMRCNKFCCGHAWCNANGCVPVEQQIENMEQGKPDSFRPIVSQGGVILG